MRSQQKDTFAFAKAAKACTDVEQLNQAFQALVSKYGVLNSSAWAVIGGDSKVHKGFGVWPREWARHYYQQKYYDIDPVLRSLLTGLPHGYWDEIISRIDVSADDMKVMDEAADYGFSDGFSMLLGTPNSAIYLVSLYGKELNRDVETRHLFELCSYVFVQEGVRLLHRNIGFRPKIHDLTKRQLEALSYKAQHYTDTQTAEEMGITVKAVEGLLDKIRKTLGVNRTPQAVMIAQEKGLIELPAQTKKKKAKERM